MVVVGFCSWPLGDEGRDVEDDMVVVKVKGGGASKLAELCS